jgi:hypothetical protein
MTLPCLQHVIAVYDNPDGTAFSVFFDVQTNQGRDYINHPSHKTDALNYDCNGRPITDHTQSEGIPILFFMLKAGFPF